ncbi:MAG: single-stranded DNA-binding protein, partial [Opitutales bacterium]
MASSFNRVILAGNMTRDPEARALPSGQALTKFSLAVNRAYTTKEGEKREEVTYVDIES